MFLRCDTFSTKKVSIFSFEVILTVMCCLLIYSDLILNGKDFIFVFFSRLQQMIHFKCSQNGRLSCCGGFFFLNLFYLCMLSTTHGRCNCFIIEVTILLVKIHDFVVFLYFIF